MIYQRLLWILLFSITFTGCAKDEGSETSADPSNLSVELISLNYETFEVIIQASADNATEYQMYIGTDTEPVLVNQDGYFEYTFDNMGVYTVYIRAYGASGRYIKKEILVYLKPPVTINDGYTTPLEYDGYQLVWADEFTGSSVNTSNWDYDIGDGCPNVCGWGNNELEYYLSANANVAGDVLTITAKQQNYADREYTSAKLTSKSKYSFQYGRIDIRALLPEGQGIWPALWMLGNNISDVSWPDCGEIDIMEMIGGEGRENQVHGTIHYDNGGYAHTGQSYILNSGTFNDEYHVFSLIWDENSLKWYVDDEFYFEVDISDSGKSEFHQKFYFILNVAVGGDWPGSPDSETIFPQEMKVDYLRVFQKN